ncbi:MAG: hypothetical protein PSU93_08470 [Methylobacter sp.]|uniref:Uncharacterized protein n=1 Tax=Candidatus Methylobacter titanis TaxID=3053457 RepID=A0AA43Q655_9GAMM|nr:hypothetical protein [Candidatus Methylobacter titanis]
MSKPITFKKLVASSLTTAAMVFVSQGTFAHTRFETSSVAEGVKVHNAVNIGHGCPPSTARKATFGTNVIFPNAVSYTPVIGVDSGAGKVYSTTAATDFYAPLAGIGVMIRNGGAFPEYQYKADPLNNIDGFWAGGKAYDQTISTPVQVEFASAAVTIKPASCARTVTFYAAISDHCSIDTPSTVATDEEVLYWSPIPNFAGVPGQPFDVAAKYSNFDGYQDAAHTIKGDGWSSPATLKVTRNLTTNPLPSGCTGNAGAGDDIHVYPSAKQINAEMPIWSGTHQNGTKYWH